MVATIRPASAVPSFARQTGAPCSTCHVGSFGPQLTPYGREFKLNGYVWGEASQKFGGITQLPPISAMLQVGFTSTTTSIPGGSVPGWGDNNNFNVNQYGLFYAGRIFGKLGAWIQETYNGVAQRGAWDNWDVRYADTLSVFGKDLVLGVSANNNPTTQDLWNTTPSWVFPYITTGLAPTPAARTRIDGTYAQQMAGVTAYAMWDKLVYAEFGAYTMLAASTQQWFGVTPGDGTIGLAPYWRLAVQKEWDGQYASIGTFGFSPQIVPSGVLALGAVGGLPLNTPPYDRYLDIGFDATYQFLGEGKHTISLYASLIHESAFLDATFAAGLSANAWNELNTFRLSASYYYDNTVGFTVGLFNTWGTTDTGLYTPATAISGSANGSPNSSGYVLQLDYTPFGKADSFAQPWVNLRLGVQYTIYTLFNGGTTNYDGNGRNSWDNNTLYVFAWIAF
jgi:hypothetical protein